MQHKRHIGSIIGIIAVSAFIGLIIVEVLSSIFLPAPIFYKINVTALNREYRLSPNKILIYEPNPGGGEFNKYGYRGKEFTYKRNEKRRIVFIGDSVVEGIGVKPRERFTESLNNKLGNGFEVINLGVSGYSFLQEFEYLKEKGLKFLPDYVFWGICQNDFNTSSLELGHIGKKIQNIDRGDFYNYYYTNVNKLEDVLLSFNTYKYIKYFLSQNSKPNLRDKINYDDLRKSEMANLLKKLRIMSNKYNFKIVFILLPIRRLSELPIKISELEDLIKKENFIYLDLNNQIEGAWIDHVHLNPEGHKIVADMLYANITGDVSLYKFNQNVESGLLTLATEKEITEKGVTFVYFYPTLQELDIFPERISSRDFLYIKDIDDSASFFVGKGEDLYMIPEESYFLFNKYLSKYGYRPVIEDLFYSSDIRSNFVATTLVQKKSSDSIMTLDFENPVLNHIVSHNIDDSEKVKIISDGLSAENHILDLSGDEEQLMISMNLDDYIFEADFKIINYRVGFVFRAQDKNNLYMHQITTFPDLAGVRWHRKVNGKYIVEHETRLPFKIELNEWYHIKCIVNKGNFKIYLCKIVESECKELSLVAEWTDPQNQFAEGYIGFRESAGSKSAQSEHAQLDNIIINSL